MIKMKTSWIADEHDTTPMYYVELLTSKSFEEEQEDAICLLVRIRMGNVD